VRIQDQYYQVALVVEGREHQGQRWKDQRGVMQIDCETGFEDQREAVPLKTKKGDDDAIAGVNGD